MEEGNKAGAIHIKRWESGSIRMWELKINSKIIAPLTYNPDCKETLIKSYEDLLKGIKIGSPDCFVSPVVDELMNRSKEEIEKAIKLKMIGKTVYNKKGQIHISISRAAEEIVNSKINQYFIDVVGLKANIKIHEMRGSIDALSFDAITKIELLKEHLKQISKEFISEEKPVYREATNGLLITNACEFSFDNYLSFVDPEQEPDYELLKEKEPFKKAERYAVLIFKNEFIKEELNFIYGKIQDYQKSLSSENKKQLTGYSTALKPYQIEKLYQLLTEELYLDSGSQKEAFKAVFTPEPLPEGIKIKWLKSNILLSHFVYQLLSGNESYWDIAQKIFISKKGLYIKNLAQSYNNNPAPTGLDSMMELIKKVKDL